MTLHHWPNPCVPWRSFHNHWVVRLVEYLNRGVLPDGFRARPTELIVGVEPDVLLLREGDTPYKTANQPWQKRPRRPSSPHRPNYRSSASTAPMTQVGWLRLLNWSHPVTNTARNQFSLLWKKSCSCYRKVFMLWL
jgi:hypothetical protein